ncbi:MAG: S41 family peptidase [Ignavibacterium sp.]|jgi:C-terminal processing protease CtpA/Prc|nr:S41 family peptidase [Ignavibacterium sp.]
MRKYLIILLSVSLLACSSKQELSATQKLQLTAKVWGFLKYYHPKVNEGKINWDDQLANIIQKLDDVKTNQDLSELYITWIESLGEVQPCMECEPSKEKEYFDNNFNLSWLQNEIFTPQLIEKLKYIEQNRTQSQYYISIEGATTYFDNEPIYKGSQWDDENIRLITLFKYWNVIEYFYPYKYVMDQNWDEVLVEKIPRFQQIKSEEEYHVLLHELTVKLCDSHSFFVTDLVRSFAGNKYIAAKFKIIDDKAVITDFYNDSLAQLDDLQKGDAVLKVDGVPVLEKFHQNEKYINGSNESVKKMGYSFRWIFNGNTDSVKITYERRGEIRTKTVRRYDRTAFKSQEVPGKKWEILKGNIGYGNMEEDVVMLEDLPVMMEELNNTKAIIFDLRNYPEFIWHDLVGYLNKEIKVWAKFTQPDLTYPGRFIWVMADSIGKINPSPYKGKVLVLLDEGTQSRAESFVMALQTVDGAITVGRQTSGADGNIADFTFFDDKTTWITGLGVFYPDGRETQRIGIVPDINVPLTVEDIRSGHDAILEKALEIANDVK